MLDDPVMSVYRRITCYTELISHNNLSKYTRTQIYTITTYQFLFLFSSRSFLDLGRGVCFYSLLRSILFQRSISFSLQ